MNILKKYSFALHNCAQKYFCGKKLYEEEIYLKLMKTIDIV